MSIEITHDQLEQIERISALMPSLRQFYFLKENLSTYSERINNYYPHRLYQERQLLAKEILRNYVTRLFDNDELQRCNLDFLRSELGLVMGIVDHHKIIDDPKLLSVPLVSQFFRLYRAAGKASVQPIITFATSCVPFSESFSRRSLTLNNNRINIFPAQLQNTLVYSSRVRHIDLMLRLDETRARKKFSAVELQTLGLVQQVLDSISYSTCRDLSDQFTKINFHLWRMLFSTDLHPPPDLISISMEHIARDLLIHFIDSDRDCLPYRLIFDDILRSRFLHTYQGLVGAWTRDGSRGSEIFWGCVPDGKLERVKINGRELRIGDKGDCVPLTPDGIRDALERRRIFPGQIITFITLLFFCGIKPICGWSIEFVRRMKLSTLDLVREQFPEDAAAIETIPVDNMNLMSILGPPGSDGGGAETNAYFLDVVLRGGITRDELARIDGAPFNSYMLPNLQATEQYAINKYAIRALSENI